MRKFIILLLIIVLILPLTVFARIGVGIGVSEIRVEKPLKAGGIYDIPSLPIFNTGDESSDYGIGIAYHVERTELRPPKEWFSFNPSPIHLEPTKSQQVLVKLTLPVKVTPGDYFCYLEAYPVVKTQTGASVGIAAGARLFFTVVPSNIVQAITFRVFSFWTIYSPWTWIVLVMTLGAIVIVLFKKFFRFQIGVSRK